MAAHAASFSDPSVQTIRHASSPDLAAWTVDDAPALQASADAMAWDHVNTETPTVVYVPDAPADRRYLMLYSGAAGAFPYPGYAFPDYAIGPRSPRTARRSPGSPPPTRRTARTGSC